MVTPIALLRRGCRRGQTVFLLESVEGGEKMGALLLLGYDPVRRARCKTAWSRSRRGKPPPYRPQSRSMCCRELLGKYRAPASGTAAVYRRVRGLTSLTQCWATPNLKLRIRRGAWEDSDLLLRFDKVIAYDHCGKKLVLVVNMSTDSVMMGYGKACAELENMAALVNDQSPLPPLQAAETPASPA